MVRMGISVERPTEERFTQKVLVPYFNAQGIFITPILISGNVSVPRVTHELENLAYSFDYVTTLYDFYGFKDKREDDTKLSLEARVQQSLKVEIKHKVVPYIQMYEFEGLLFSSPLAIVNFLGGPVQQEWAQRVLDQFSGNPESVNDSVNTAPSKRLEKHTSYKKMIDGPDIAQAIGMQALRSSCSGFNDWIVTLESFAGK